MKRVISTAKTFLLESGLVNIVENTESEIERLFFPHEFNKRLEKYTPVVVYQMGKVASASIYHSLKEVYPGIVLHTHTFGHQDSNWKIQKVYKNCIAQKKPLDIISLTREPISRNISAFFQNFKRYTGLNPSQSTFSVEELKNIYLEKFWHEEPLSWFDDHIKPQFGIDVFSTVFPDNGIGYYSNEQFRLLVIKSEIDNLLKVDSVREFLKLPSLHLVQKNISEKKGYANIYRSFMNGVKFPPSYIAKMLDSKYAKYFYDQGFLTRTGSYWSDLS